LIDSRKLTTAPRETNNEQGSNGTLRITEVHQHIRSYT